MLVLIKTDHTAEELVKFRCVSPTSFSAVKTWRDLKVIGDDYYVKKAVDLGAIDDRPKKKPKANIEK